MNNLTNQPFTIQNASLYRRPEGLSITTLWACPNSNPKTLTVTVGLSILELPLSITPQLSAVFHAFRHWPWVLGAASLSVLRLQFLVLVAPFSFMRVAEPSCLLPLPWMQWVSSLFSAATLNVVGELSPLGCWGTVLFFEFSVPIVTVSSSDLQLETCYGVLYLSYLLYLRQKCLSAKMAASPVAAGPYSNTYLWKN